MTAYRCDLALIDQSVEPNVMVNVEHGRFESVVPGGSPRGSDPDAIHLPGLTVPGMANAHSHAFHRALRSNTQADRGSFWTWRDLMYATAERLDPDNYHRLARAAFAEMALAGITCVGEFHYVHHRPDGSPYADPNAMGEAVLAAADEAGIRITLLDTVYLHGGLDEKGHRATTGAQRRFTDLNAEAWIERIERIDIKANQLLGAAIHSVRAVDPEAMRSVAEWANRGARPLHAHVSEQPAENDQCVRHYGRTPIAVLHDVGALGPNFTAVHATHLTDDDIELLSITSSAVCMCPTTERDLGDGIGPTASFAARNIPIALGSDSHAVIDHLEEARVLELHERLRSLSRGSHSAAELFHMASIEGHRSLGWHDAGTIEVGKRADLVSIDLDSVRTAGSSASTALQAAVFAGSAADIHSVVVDGEQIVANHTHRTLDVAAELATSIRAVVAP